MIPFVFYYGGQMIELPAQLSLSPYEPQYQFLPLPTQLFMVPTPAMLNPLTTEQPEHFPKCDQQNSRKSQKRREEVFEESQGKGEEKPIKRIQNPHRNIYTNLTNLVLNFIVCKKKVGDLLSKIDPTLVGDKLIRFYKYIKELKSYFCSYFNFQKVRKLIEGREIGVFDEEFHRTFRIAAKYILEYKIPACLLTSKKLSPLLRANHLNVRREILALLEEHSVDESQH